MATLIDPSAILVTVLVETALVTDPPLELLLDMARAMCEDETEEAWNLSSRESRDMANDESRHPRDDEALGNIAARGMFAGRHVWHSSLENAMLAGDRFLERERTGEKV